MTSNNMPLTDEQRELVANNHKLIYAFGIKTKISMDEYYDILAIGLCKAAKIFNKNRGEFSTVAYRCMQNELNGYWRSKQKQSCIPDDFVLSYDKDDSYSQDSLSKYLIDYNADESMLYDIISTEFRSALTNKEKVIYQHLLDGLTCSEIALELKCKKQSVSYHIKKIRSKAINYLNCK